MLYSVALVAFQYLILNINAKGVASIPIRTDSIGNFYGLNFTVGANHDQKLYLDLDYAHTSLSLHQYSPSSKSVIARASHVEKFPGSGGLQSQTITTYNDVFGVPPLLVQSATIQVVTKTVPARLNLKGYYGPLPLSFGGSWFRSLCNLGMVAECRYGVAMGLGGTGQLVFGQTDETVFEGELATTHIEPFVFSVRGDVVVNNKTLHQNVIMTMDPSFTDITGPYDDVQKIFQELGIAKEHSSTHEFLYGTYPCEKPPSIGFRFPSGSGKIFYVSGSAMKASLNLAGYGRCEATLYGDRAYEKGILANQWDLGTNFFLGRYVDYDISNNLVGISNLRNPRDGSSSGMPNNSNSGTNSGSGNEPNGGSNAGQTGGSNSGSQNNHRNEACRGRQFISSSAIWKCAGVLALVVFDILPYL